MTATDFQQLDKQVRAINPMLYAALAYHRNHRGKMLDLGRQPAMKAMYAETRRFGSVIKSTQGGVSEWLLVYGITDASMGRNVFWVLPNGGVVGRFVKERLNKTLANTPEYKRLLGESMTMTRFAATIGMKQFGAGTISYTGSMSSSAFTEFVADTLIIDELDQCDQKNVAMAKERLGFSPEPAAWRISNPTITGFGIDEEYSRSTQGIWHIKCECGNYVHPDPFEVLLREVQDDEYVVRDPDFDWDQPDSEPNLICPHCNRVLPRFGEGRWIERYPRRNMAGYHFSKLFTSATSLREVVEDFNLGLSNSVRMMRCYNSNFGYAYDAPGAKITRDMIDSARGDYRQHNPKAKCILGADVGNTIHVVIAKLFPWESRYGAQVVLATEVHEEKELVELYDRYDCIAGVVDAMPEERMSRRITQQRRGMFRAYYDRGRGDKVITAQKIVTAARTPAMDSVKEALQTGQIVLPQDIDAVPGFYDQLMASTRTYDEDTQRFVWNEGSKEDHYHHALVYCNLSRAMVLSAM